jgi:hypothetical protein
LALKSAKSFFKGVIEANIRGFLGSLKVDFVLHETHAMDPAGQRFLLPENAGEAPKVIGLRDDLVDGLQKEFPGVILVGLRVNDKNVGFAHFPRLFQGREKPLLTSKKP